MKRKDQSKIQSIFRTFVKEEKKTLDIIADIPDMFCGDELSAGHKRQADLNQYSSDSE